ncbi:phage portal protein [Thermomonospora amylolytica]|uniref:phage portal protein n=1 Tax=Thermomonospora amylolytica TaxID=1411117 RepID=UPI001F1C29EE|nr:phage portal protein [Thermomonospora amylolytica]
MTAVDAVRSGRTGWWGRLRSWLRGGRGTEERALLSVDDYAQIIAQFGSWVPLSGGVQQTLAGTPAEEIETSLEGYAQGAYKANGIVFACMLTRMLAFSGIRFAYQRIRNGRTSDLFGTQALALLEEPWVGGTTQDLLLRMIQDADLAGNAYITKIGGELVRLRPDWVQVILEPREVPVSPLNPDGGQVGFRRAGYMYRQDGTGEPVFFLPEQVAHFAPIPDPLASFRGMSWLTPVLREIAADGQMMRHKAKFLENAATPNMVVSFKESVTREQFEEFMEILDSRHAGAENAYKTLYLGGGADATVVGADLQQLDFKAVQGHGETRIAAAAGVPPVIVGLSEGLQAATYSNYSQARRRLADGTMHPLWANAAGSLAPLLPRENGARLWYSARDVPFLREDAKDVAEVQAKQAQTIGGLVKEGFTPESVVAAVMAEDWGLLEHTGLRSVQLHPENPDTSEGTPAAGGGDDDDG